MVRLKTSADETKATTWIAFPSAHTVIAVLRHAALAPQERELLAAVAQHLEEWQTNPQGVEARRYGTGPRYRAQVLKTTTRPTMLSARGGPFDLHQAPARLVDPGDTETSSGASAASTV